MIVPLPKSLSPLPADVGDLWRPPGKRWLKINVDGAALVEMGCAGIGGVVRTPTRRIIASFHFPIVTRDALAAEIMALICGLSLAQQARQKIFVIKDDAYVILNALERNEASPHWSVTAIFVDLKTFFKFGTLKNNLQSFS